MVKLRAVKIQLVGDLLLAFTAVFCNKSRASIVSWQIIPLRLSNGVMPTFLNFYIHQSNLLTDEVRYLNCREIWIISIASRSPEVLTQVGELLALAATRRSSHPRSLQIPSSSVWSPPLHANKLAWSQQAYFTTANLPLSPETKSDCTPQSSHQGMACLNDNVGRSHRGP